MARSMGSAGSRGWLALVLGLAVAGPAGEAGAKEPVAVRSITQVPGVRELAVVVSIPKKVDTEARARDLDRALCVRLDYRSVDDNDVTVLSGRAPIKSSTKLVDYSGGEAKVKLTITYDGVPPPGEGGYESAAVVVAAGESCPAL